MRPAFDQTMCDWLRPPAAPLPGARARYSRALIRVISARDMRRKERAVDAQSP
jgi:hypothetical protein